MTRAEASPLSRRDEKGGARPLKTVLTQPGCRRTPRAVCEALVAGPAAERAVIAGARHNVQRTGAPFNMRLEEFLTSAEVRVDR